MGNKKNLQSNNIIKSEDLITVFKLNSNKDFESKTLTVYVYYFTLLIIIDCLIFSHQLLNNCSIREWESTKIRGIILVSVHKQ